MGVSKESKFVFSARPFDALHRTYRSATLALRSGWDVPEINLISFMIEKGKRSYRPFARNSEYIFRLIGAFLSLASGVDNWGDLGIAVIH